MCGSPDSTVKYSQVWCIPEKEDCPLTEFHFDNSYKLVKGYGAKHGEPIVDVQMSQGGFPCIHYRKSHNAWSKEKEGQKKKRYYLFYPEDYYKPCEKVTYGNVTLSEADHIFEKVKSGSTYLEVSEKKLLFENREDYDYDDIHVKWSQYPKDDDTWDTYMYSMYMKKYLQWYHCPLKYPDGTADDDFTPEELLTTIKKAEEVSRGVKTFYGFIYSNIFLVFVEFFIVLAHRNDAIKAKPYDIFMIVRRLISLFLYVYGTIICFSVWKWDGHGRVNALGTADACHNDKVLDATFDDMM